MKTSRFLVPVDCEVDRDGEENEMAPQVDFECDALERVFLFQPKPEQAIEWNRGLGNVLSGFSLELVPEIGVPMYLHESIRLEDYAPDPDCEIEDELRMKE